MIKFTDAALYYKEEQQQIKAWEYLQQATPQSVLTQFQILYRAKKKVTEYVTKAQLAGIWVCSEDLIENREIEELNQCLIDFDITTTSRIRHFLAQTGHESGGGKWKTELSDGEYLEGRTDIGNTQPGDGPKYKGAGYLQMTGRTNYQRFADGIDNQRVMEGCQYVADNYPFTSAGFWWVDNDMNTLCDTDPCTEEVTLRVNGGYNGLDDRKEYYGRAELYIK